LKDVNEFVITDKNIVSFKRVSAEIPLISLFSKPIDVNINIHQPKIVFDDSLLKGRKKKQTQPKAFKINKVNIIDGEVIYDTPKLYVNLLKFNLLSFPRKRATIYRLTSPHLKVMFPIGKKQVTVEGQMLCEFRELNNSWKVGKFYWETEHANINVNGRVMKDGRIALNIYTQGSARQILDPLIHKLSIREFMYGNARLEKGKSGKVTIEGDFNYNTFFVNGEEFKNMRGSVQWDNKSKRLRIFSHLQADGHRATFNLNKIGKTIQIEAGRVPAAKVSRLLDIDDMIPLGGMIKDVTFDINGRQFDGSANLEQIPDNPNPKEFNAGGHVKFAYNTKSKSVSFSGENLKGEFGTIQYIKGKSTPKERTKLSLQIKGHVDRAQFLDKYTRYYINLPLKRWNLKGGNSTIDLDLKKINRDFFIESNIHFKNFYSGKEKIESMKGRISTAKNLTTGTLKVTDKNLTGNMLFQLDKKKDDLKITFENLHGESKKVLNLLDIDLSLTGQMTGDFVYSDKAGMKVPLVTGRFEAKRANFYDFIFDDLRGDLEYSDSTTLKNLTYRYMNGKGKADIFIKFDTEEFDIKGNIEKIDLNRFNNEFKGTTDLMFRGMGHFDIDPIQLTFQSSDIFFFKDRSFKVIGDGTILTDFAHFKLETKSTLFDSKSESPFIFRLNRKNNRFTGDYEGELTDINLLIPWGDNKGKVKFRGRISGPSGDQLSTEGYAEFKGKVLSFPNFPHVLEDFSGDMIFRDLNFTLRSMKGTLGGGTVQGSGYLKIEDNKLDSLYIGMGGKQMTLYPWDRTSFTLDADLTLKYLKERKKLLMAGDIKVHSGLWEREVDENLYFNTNPSLSASGSTIMDMLEYDLKLVGEENIQLNNAFGEAKGKFNLRLTGNTDFPIVLGVIESREGAINFSGKKFDLIKAKFTFNDKFQNDPIMKIESEAFIKNYRIKFNINGPTSRVKPELQSSPPLPPRDILTLISVGELFRRPTSTELSTQIGTGTTGLIASELTEAIKKRTKKIFGNYLLRFEPNISSITGSSFVDSSRIIVGKEISKDFLIVYSTNFSTQRQQVVYLQYQISPSLSLIGMQNEDGRLSIDLRFRKRH
jgi:TamB, inner membrane protein subunit of TAM complex